MSMTMNEIPSSLPSPPEVYADWLVQDLRTAFAEAWPNAEFVQAVLAQLPNRLLDNCLGRNNLVLRCPALSRLSTSWQVATHFRRMMRSE